MNKPAVIITAMTLGVLIGGVAGVRQAQKRALQSGTQPVAQGSSSLQHTSTQNPTSQVSESVIDDPRSPSAPIESASRSRPEASRSIPSSGGAQVAVEVNEAEVNQLVKEAIAANADRSPILAQADDFNLTIENGRIEGGARVRIEDIPPEYLGERERALLDGVARLIPGLSNGDIYIAVSGRPQTLDGQVLLGDDLTLRVGQLDLPFSEVSNRLGVPVEAIEQRINEELQTRGIRIADLQIVGDRVMLQGDVDLSQEN